MLPLGEVVDEDFLEDILSVFLCQDFGFLPFNLKVDNSEQKDYICI